MSNTSTQQQQRYDQALAALTAKQRKFVLHYLSSLNASAAAREAGYSERTAAAIGYENLRKPQIAAAISAGMAIQAMPAEEILARLAAQARGSMADFLRVDEEEITVTWSVLRRPPGPDGDPDLEGAVFDLAAQEVVRPTDLVLRTATVRRPTVRIDLQHASEAGKLGLLKKYVEDKTGKITVEPYDAQAALIKLGEHHGLWGKAPDLLKTIDLSRLSDEQLAQIAAGDDPLKVLLGGA